MNARTPLLILFAALLLSAAGYGIYRIGMSHGSKMTEKGGESAPQVSAGTSGGKKILYWHDPMVPQQKFDKPGKSPFMDMQLVPVYAGEEGDEGTVRISPRVQQNLGVRTADVVSGALTPTLEAVGSVAFNERDVVLVQARSNGFVEKLYVRATLDPVRKGQPLADVYVPDWVAAQEEYLSAKRIAGTGLGDTLSGLQESALQRMRLAGMSEGQIRLIESTGAVHSRTTITAPVSGVITELGAREGMTIMSGAALFRINGLGTVWINAEVPENIAAQVRPGNPVEVRTPALPDAMFKGRVDAILPEVSQTTRTLKVRIEIANPGGTLAPGMFATINFTSAIKKKALLVPTEALIRTGTRNVVIVSEGDGRFRSQEVKPGMDAGDHTEILSGLSAGERVVTSGQFLIDSEASLKGVMSRLNGGDRQ